MKLTTKEYEKAILHAGLDHKEIDILKALYKFPDSTASVKELAGVLGYPWQGFAFRIGTMGRKIADYSGKYPDNYLFEGVERPAFFMLIGPYYRKEGKTKSGRPGWEMNDELRDALKNLKLV